MSPPRTSCGAPMELSPQKAEAHPILMASFFMVCALLHAVRPRSLPCPHRGALLGERLHSLTGVFGEGQQPDLAFGKGCRFFKRHRFHSLQRVETAPDGGWRVLESGVQDFFNAFIQRIG